MRTFYEFFAGGGMARAGLGPTWKCLFANDFDGKKVASYAENWGASEMRHGDINDLDIVDLPGQADLVWASFPCQDLSLAGGGAGLKGERSGTFWPFWSRVKGLVADGRKPSMIVLENVVGMLTSHRGKDFKAICDALASENYRFGAVLVDAAHFVPQSRKRVFIVAVADEMELSPQVVGTAPHPTWQPASIVRAVEKIDGSAAKRWVWWRLPEAPRRNIDLKDIIEATPTGVDWHTPAETANLLQMMSEHNRLKLERATQAQKKIVGTMYRRTRPSPTGGVQRAEIRLDGTAGCLRTPAGGSSRQIVVQADSKGVRTRLISAREAARLMGLPESYALPLKYNDSYHLLGDGLAVPAVEFIAKNLLVQMFDTQVVRKAA